MGIVRSSIKLDTIKVGATTPGADYVRGLDSFLQSVGQVPFYFPDIILPFAQEGLSPIPLNTTCPTYYIIRLPFKQLSLGLDSDTLPSFHRA